MAVMFRELVVYNDNGIPTSLKVEASIGKIVKGPRAWAHTR